MEMTLYHGEPNGPSLTVLAALYETGHDAALKKINLDLGARHSGEFPQSEEVTLSIEGEGPVLVVDGEPMADSVFIARFLNDACKDSPIVPEDPYSRWRMMTWCRQTIERTAPAAAYLGTHRHLADKLAAMDEEAFDALIANIKSDDLKARWIAVRRRDFDDAKLADSRAKIAAAFEKVEDQLSDGRDWLFGEFSIADLETFAWLCGMRTVVPEAFEGKLKAGAWCGRIKTRAAVARALSIAQTDSPENVWAPGPEINRWG